MRLSIDISPEQHQCLKAAAALQGKTIKAYVLERALSNISSSENAGLHALESVLKSRLECAEKGMVSTKSINDIFEETLQAESPR